MKIVFLNIWNFHNKEEVEGFLKEHSADTEVFCFQEAYDRTKWLCKDILLNYELTADYKYVSNHDDFPLATYIRKDIKIVSKTSLLKNTPETGLALHTQLNYKNKLVNVCNVHGISKPGDKLDNENRLRQSREIIGTYKDLGGLKIIGGDFNLEANTQSVKFFEENGYLDLIKKYKISTTRNRFIWERYPDSKQYFSDYVFVSPEVNVKMFSVINNEVSDHLPMILEIDL